MTRRPNDSVDDAHSPRDNLAESPAAPPRRRLVQGASFVVKAIVGAVIATLVGGGLTYVLTRPHRPSVDAQLSAIRKAAARRGEAAFIREARLHQSTSYVVVLQRPGSETVSDELRIYDDVKGSLVLRFAFRPEADRNAKWLFRLDAVRDLAGSGQDQIIGGFHQFVTSGGLMSIIPVAGYWDNGTGRYALTPLLPRQPVDDLRLRALDRTNTGALDRYIWRMATVPTALQDRRTGVSVRGYGAADFVVERTEDFHGPSGAGLLVSAFLGLDGRGRRIVRVTGWRIAPSAHFGDLIPCQPLNSDIRLGRLGELRPQIRERWRAAHLGPC